MRWRSRAFAAGPARYFEAPVDRCSCGFHLRAIMHAAGMLAVDDFDSVSSRETMRFSSRLSQRSMLCNSSLTHEDSIRLFPEPPLPCTICTSKQPRNLTYKPHHQPYLCGTTKRQPGDVGHYAGRAVHRYGCGVIATIVNSFASGP